MIVEITGVPGAGKTTLLRKITNSNDNNIVLFSDDLVLKHLKLDFIELNLLRRILSDFILLVIFLQHFNNYRTFMKQVMSLLMKNRERILIKINTLRNIILKLGRFQFIEKNFIQEVVLVDEGISHIPFMLTDYSGKREIDIDLLLEPLSAQVSKVKVIILDHEGIDVKRRLHVRGHKRMKKRKSANFLNQFVHLNDQVIEAYRSLKEMRFLEKRLLKVGAENDEEKFMHIINS
jgi:broad-specificity NMP kinase